MIPRPLTLHVLGAGAVTSVGLSLPATAAAIRAALDSFAETRFLAEGEPIHGARVVLDEEQEAAEELAGGVERLADMLGMAVEECLLGQNPREMEGYTALFLVLPDRESALGRDRLAASCEEACSRYMQVSRPRIFPLGGSGCVEALSEAREFLARHPEFGRVVIAGVDSWLNAPSIQQALERDRILTEENGDGFIPGEASAAILVGRGANAGSPCLRLLGLGKGEEPAGLFSDEPCYGKGLAQAITRALNEAGWQPHHVNLRMTDITGEEYFFNEAAYAWSSVLREPEPAGKEFLIPSTRVGEVGAASGLLMLAYVWHLACNGRAPGPCALIQLSSDGGTRGAIAASIP